MFNAIPVHLPEVYNFFIIPFPKHYEETASVRLLYDIGSGDQDLMPIIKDIADKACPLVNTGRFTLDHLRYISLACDCLRLAFGVDNPSKSNFYSTIDFAIDFDDLYDALNRDQISLSVHLCARNEDGEDEVIEAYDIDLDSKLEYVSISVDTPEDEDGFYLIDPPSLYDLVAEAGAEIEAGVEAESEADSDSDSDPGPGE